MNNKRAQHVYEKLVLYIWARIKDIVKTLVKKRRGDLWRTKEKVYGDGRRIFIHV